MTLTIGFILGVLTTIGLAALIANTHEWRAHRKARRVEWQREVEEGWKR